MDFFLNLFIFFKSLKIIFKGFYMCENLSVGMVALTHRSASLESRHMVLA